MTEQYETFDFLIEEDEPASPEEQTLLAEEPLFAAMLRRAVGKIWGDDPVMADFVNYVAQPLSDYLGHKAAKGGPLLKR